MKYTLHDTRPMLSPIYVLPFALAVTSFCSPRGPYNGDTSGEARLPGVDGERPMRVQGSSVLVTFSASYWTGVAPAGEDYGWRLVCFAADDDDHAKALVSEAERAADRAEAVDAVNTHG